MCYSGKYYDLSKKLVSIIGDFCPENHHWLGGNDVDQGPSYCKTCALKKVESGDAEFVDGGWLTDCDGSKFCDSCAIMLDYTLTDEGAESEKDHFKQHGATLPLSQQEAYELSALLDALPDDTEVHKIVEKATGLAV